MATPPPMSGRRLAFALAALVVVVSSCTSTPDAKGPPNISTAPTPSSTSAGCPVTVPHPVPQHYPWRTSLFGSDHSYGNGRLWVGGLGEQGVIAVDRGSTFIDPRGHVTWKLGWWREVAGRLIITGHRLDGAGRLTADVGTVAEYGPRGFVSSGVTFPSQGCWRVTGRVGGADLTFSTLVVIRR